MIYQQQTVEADVPAMKEEAPPAGSSSCFCSYAADVAAIAVVLAASAAVTAAALSGSFCLCAYAAAKMGSTMAADAAAKTS